MTDSIYTIGKEKSVQIGMAVYEKGNRKVPAKRINIISLKMVREGSILYDSRKVESPSDAAKLGMKFIDDSDREQVIICCLDTKNQPTSISIVSIGSLNSSIVHPRETFKTAILSNAASVIVFHNHPSGDPTPSNEDVNITHRLKECGEIIGIELIDHIIIGNGNFVSMKDKGIL